MSEVVAEEVEELAVVGRWQSLDEAYEHALVVLAMNLDCFVREEGGAFALEAEPAAEQAIREEFSEYRKEQSERRERVEMPIGAVGGELAILWVLSLVVVFALQHKDPAISDLYCNSSVGLFGEGEWWRPFTALFLHGDLGHLAGNIFIGGIFCLMVAHSFGQLRGWLLILASGVVGNGINAAVHYPDPFLSLGASTATFGAVGLLVGMGVVLAWRSRSYRELKPVIVPVAVGLTVLGWYGVGGENTDVMGHVFGWLAGLGLGLVAASRMEVKRHLVPA